MSVFDGAWAVPLRRTDCIQVNAVSKRWRILFNCNNHGRRTHTAASWNLNRDPLCSWQKLQPSNTESIMTGCLSALPFTPIQNPLLVFWLFFFPQHKNIHGSLCFKIGPVFFKIGPASPLSGWCCLSFSGGVGWIECEGLWCCSHDK